MSALTAAVSVAGALAVVVLGRQWRPPPARVALPPRRRPRRPPSTAAAVVAATTAALLSPWAGAIAGVVVLALPGVRRRRAAARQQAAVEADIPEMVDLLALAVGSGLTVVQALHAVACRAHGPLAAALGGVLADVARGRRLADAIDDLPAVAGEAIRPLAATLAACERYGAPVRESLDRLAVEARDRQRRRAEAAARRLPVVLLFPLVACILPAFALLAVAPLLADALAALRL